MCVTERHKNVWSSDVLTAVNDGHCVRSEVTCNFTSAMWLHGSLHFYSILGNCLTRTLEGVHCFSFAICQLPE